MMKYKKFTRKFPQKITLLCKSLCNSHKKFPKKLHYSVKTCVSYTENYTTV